MFSCLLGMEVQWVNASYKFWSIGKENPLFFVMVELVRFRRKRLQFGQFSPARTVFLYLFSAALSSISDIVLFASFDFVIFFVILSSFFSIFLCFFPTSFFFYLCQPFASQSLISFDDLWLTLLL